MGKDLINARDILGKEVVALKDGSYFGKVQSVGINTEEKRVTGLFIKLKGILAGKIFVPFSGIQSFGGHGVTLKEEFDIDNPIKTVEEKEILEMPVITIDGTLLGNVDSFTFNKLDGTIMEYILSEGLVRDTLQGKGLLRGDNVARIGRDVIIAHDEVDESNLEEIKDKEEIAVLKATFPLHEIEDSNIQTDDFEEDTVSTENSVEKGWQQTLQQVKVMSEKIKLQANKVGDEAKEFWTEAQTITQNKLEKLNQVIDNWQGKLTAIKQKEPDEFSQHLLEEIKDKTVSSPLYDEEGNIIILPGQIINNVVLKKAMEKGKLHQLFILAATKDVEDQIEEVEKEEQF